MQKSRELGNLVPGHFCLEIRTFFGQNNESLAVSKDLVTNSGKSHVNQPDKCPDIYLKTCLVNNPMEKQKTPEIEKNVQISGNFGPITDFF